MSEDKTQQKSKHARGHQRHHQAAGGSVDAVMERSPATLAMKLKGEYATRFHMFLIVATCVAVALLITKGLLEVGLTTMWVRYIVALIAAYATFFIGIWVWLHLSKYGRHLRANWGRESRNDFLGDVPVDIIPNIRIGEVGSNASPDKAFGGGGLFDGGGASGSWGDALPSTKGSSSKFGLEDFGDVDLGEGGCALVIAGILLVALLFVIFGAATYVIYQAPIILAEVVFEVLLGSPLARGARALNSANWVRVLFARTWLPFAVLLAVAMMFAIYCHGMFPELTTAGQVVQAILK